MKFESQKGADREILSWEKEENPVRNLIWFQQETLDFVSYVSSHT